MFSLGKSCPAGFILTENQSFCFESEGNLASIYDCPIFHSSHHILNKCTDRTPEPYEVKIQSFDPITGQAYPALNEQNCLDQLKSLLKR